MRTRLRRGFSLMEAVVALSITAMIVGSLGFLLIYASRTLTQSFSDSTVQQQGVVALRKISDDMIQSNIYSVYSVGNPYAINSLAPAVGGLNVTFLSPYKPPAQPNPRIFQFGPSPYPLRFQSWVSYAVDASQKLIRYDNCTATAPPFTPLPVSMNPLPTPALQAPLTVTDMTGSGGTTERSSHVIAKGIGTLDPLALKVATAELPVGVPRYLILTVKIRDNYGSGPARFNQLNFTTQLYPRN